MNHNFQNTSTEVEQNIDPYQMSQGERDAHIEIGSRIAQESVGTVALHTTMDLNPEERQNLITTIAARGEQAGAAPTGFVDSSSSGWGEYGDRDFAKEFQSPAFNQEIRKIDSLARGEFAAFTDNENGTSTIHYQYGDKSYKDDTGRPGNSIDMVFTVSSETSNELKELLTVNPSLINEVVRQQWLSLGLADDRFKRSSSPFAGHTENFSPNAKKRVLNVYDANRDGTFDGKAINYSDAHSIAEAKQSLDRSAETEQSTNEVYDVRTNQAAKDARELVRDMLESDATPEDVYDAVVDMAEYFYEQSQEAETPELNAEFLAKVAGYDMVAAELRDQYGDAIFGEEAEETPKATPDTVADAPETLATTTEELDDVMMKRWQEMGASPELMMNLLANEIDSIDKEIDKDEDMSPDDFMAIVDKRQAARDAYKSIIVSEMAGEGVRAVQSRYESQMRTYVDAAARYGVPIDEITFPMIDAEENDRALNIAANQLWLIQEVLEQSENEFSKDGISSLIKSAKDTLAVR